MRVVIYFCIIDGFTGKITRISPTQNPRNPDGKEKLYDLMTINEPY